MFPKKDNPLNRQTITVSFIIIIIFLYACVNTVKTLTFRLEWL